MPPGDCLHGRQRRGAISSPGKTLILTATYNERDNAPEMVRRLRATGIEADLLFVDDSSPDGTGGLLDSLSTADPGLHVLHRSGKLGVGSAHLDGILWAYDHGYETLISLDCDFTHSPEDIPGLIGLADDGDVVVGNRFVKKSSLAEWNLLRRALTHVGHLLTDKVLGMPNDATGSFRLYRLSRIPRQLFDLVESRGYAFFFESLFLVYDNGFTVRDLPIDLPARTYGSSKMSWREAAKSARRVFELGWILRTRPQTRRIAKRGVERAPGVPEVSEWDGYWSEKSDHGSVVYDVIAALYRSLVLRRNLRRAIRREFTESSKLLHAGCGSGQVDEGLHDHYQITALDLSRAALELYQKNNPRALRFHQASIFELPWDDGVFDGAYNLGVVEHFDENEIVKMLRELVRVTRPGGKVLLFWPHRRSTSVFVLGMVHRIMRGVFRSDKQLHPPEITYVRSRSHAREVLEKAGLTLSHYSFGPADGFVQAVVVGTRE